MNKRIIAFSLSCIIGMSFIGCSITNNKESKVEPKVVSEAAELPGTWSSDYNRDEVTALFNEGILRIEEVCNNFGLEYKISEDIIEETKNNETISVNDNHIYLDNENPEPNRLESMYYGFKQYGSDLASGQIIMKIGFNLDKEAIKENGQFNFEDTSIASFSEAFTGVKDRDYSQLNTEIYNAVANNEGLNTIENNLDGIKETITITDNYLLYKLETKEYNFKG